MCHNLPVMIVDVSVEKVIGEECVCRPTKGDIHPPGTGHIDPILRMFGFALVQSPVLPMDGERRVY